MDINNLQEQLFVFLKANSTQAFSAQSLTDGLHLNETQAFTKVVQALAALERARKVKVTEAGDFQYNAESEGVIGIFKSNDKGFGFVKYDDNAEDIFINPDNTLLALQGDEVRIKVLSKGDAVSGKGPEGQVVEIMTRHSTQLVGEF